MKKLEIELEELDLAMQKGVESKGISITLNEIDSIVNTIAMGEEENIRSARSGQQDQVIWIMIKDHDQGSGHIEPFL